MTASTNLCAGNLHKRPPLAAFVALQHDHSTFCPIYGGKGKITPLKTVT
jgi:hypothetical protein